MRALPLSAAAPVAAGAPLMLAAAAPSPARAASDAAAMAADPTTFVMRRGADTLFVEHDRRDVGARGGTVSADVVNVRSGGARLAVHADVGPDALVTRMALRAWLPGAAPDAAPFQATTAAFRGDTVYADSQRVATRPGALPYYNVVVALVEQIVRRARVLGATAGAPAVEVPVFVIASGGRTVSARVTPVGADSVALTLAGTELRLRADAAGAVLGGLVPAQGLVLERVAGPPTTGRADAAPPGRDVVRHTAGRAAAVATPASTLVAATEPAAYAVGRRYTRWLFGGAVDSLVRHLSPVLLNAVGGRDGLAARSAELATEAGPETAVVREVVYASQAGTEYYRVSRFARGPDTTRTTRWAWRGDTVRAVQTTLTPAPAPSAYLDYQTRAPLRLPFETPAGAVWYVGWGGRTVLENYHATAPDQRFASDFVLTRGGAMYAGRGAANADYFGFGAPVVAPAAGTVVRALDAVPDNTPGETNAWAPPGNYVVIDHGGGEFSLVAHLRRGSVRVRPGERVAAGAALGECGNSGRSTLPHVHYHLQTGPDYRQGVGLPALFQGYVADGVTVARGEPVRGQYVRFGPLPATSAR